MGNYRVKFIAAAIQLFVLLVVQSCDLNLTFIYLFLLIQDKQLYFSGCIFGTGAHFNFVIQLN